LNTLLVKPIVFAAKSVGKLLGALPELAEDTGRVLTYGGEHEGAGIKDALSAWWRGHLISPVDMSAVREFDGTIESALNALKGSTKELQIDLARQFKAKSSLLTKQMNQLNNSRTALEREVMSNASEIEGIEQKINVIRGVPPAVGKEQEQELKLIDLQKDLRTYNANASAAKNKLQYVDRLRNGITTFDNKLETEGVAPALAYLNDFEHTIKQSPSPLLQEVGYAEDFTNKLKEDLTKQMGSVMSEKLTSKNLDSDKYFLKEWARMKATKSDETYKLWAANPENLKKMRELKDSDQYLGMFGKKISDLAHMIETDVKGAASFAGKSPQDIAHMLKLPAVAVGTIGASMAAFKTFSWFHDSGITLVGSQAKLLAAEIQQLKLGGRSKPLIDQAISSLSIVQSNSDEIRKTFGDDPQASLRDHIPAISQAILSLSQIHEKWAGVISDAADQTAATKTRDDLGRFIVEVAADFNKLAANAEKDQKQ
jgi:hypothetical protein